MAKKGDLKPVLKTCIGFDEKLAEKIKAGSDRFERGWNQEIRFALREYYGLNRTPAEASADAVSA